MCNFSCISSIAIRYNNICANYFYFVVMAQNSSAYYHDTKNVLLFTTLKVNNTNIKKM